MALNFNAIWRSPVALYGLQTANRSLDTRHGVHEAYGGCLAALAIDLHPAVKLDHDRRAVRGAVDAARIEDGRAIELEAVVVGAVDVGAVGRNADELHAALQGVIDHADRRRIEADRHAERRLVPFPLHEFG